MRTFTYSGNENSPIGAREGAGIILSVNGVARAVTDSAGEAKIVVPADVQSISARRPPTTVGVAQLDLMPGRANSVDIVVNDDGIVYAEGTPRVDEIRQMLLPHTFSAFTGRVTDSRGNTVKIAQLASVDAYDAVGMPIGSLTSMFSLGVDGTFRPTSITTLRNLFNAQLGRITQTITGIDSANNVYTGKVSFHLSRNAVDGRLAAPASFSGLRLNGIRVVGKILNTEIVVSTVTDDSGRFAFPDLPNGNLTIAVETLQNGRYYYGAGVYSLTGPAGLVVPLATAAEDLVVTLSAMENPTAVKASAQAAVIGFNVRRPGDLSSAVAVVLPKLGASNGSELAPGASASVSVTAGAQNVPSTQTATLTVWKGTVKVILTYIVGTADSPILSGFLSAVSVRLYLGSY